ncbi:Gag-pol polyprotein, partial [Operophtera brumata]
MTGADELKDLKAKRASIKGRLTTFEKYLDELKPLVTISKLRCHETKTRLKKLEGLFEEYDLIQTSIEVKQENPENQIERESSENRFYKCMAEAQEIIDKYKNVIDALTGSAASVIASLELSSRNYDIAWKLLCDRYNDKRKLVCTHLKAMFDAPITSEASSLRSLADHIAKHLRALSTLGEKTDNWDSLIIFLFSAKLDSVTSIKWEEYKGSLSEVPNLEIFYAFLRMRADVLEATAASSSEH